MPPHTDQMSKMDLHCKALLVFQEVYTSLAALHIPSKHGIILKIPDLSSYYHFYNSKKQD